MNGRKHRFFSTEANIYTTRLSVSSLCSLSQCSFSSTSSSSSSFASSSCSAILSYSLALSSIAELLIVRHNLQAFLLFPMGRGESIGRSNDIGHGWETSETFQTYPMHPREHFGDRCFHLIVDRRTSHRTADVRTSASW